MSSLLPCTQNSRLMPKPNSSTKPLVFGNSSALTIRKPNSNVIAPYTASHPNKHSIGTPTHHPTCNDRVPLFLLGIDSSHFPDCQSGHIVHSPGCHPVVLRPLARHWMPVSSASSCPVHAGIPASPLRPFCRIVFGFIVHFCFILAAICIFFAKCKVKVAKMA